MPLNVTILGSGTSAGVPMIGCHCAVCLSDRRTRCSIVIESQGTAVLIDTTPELRLQACANRIDRIDAVVFTHAHADHVMGLDDCRRYNAVSGSSLDVWASRATFDVLDACFGYAFKKPDPELTLFRPHLIQREITGPFEIGPMRFVPVPLMHGKMPVLGFRVGPFAYCTDVNFISDESYTLLSGVDTLIIDALQWKTHATHFTIEEAMAAARRIGARRTLFTHISHQVGHAETSTRLPEGFELSYDGQRVSVG